MELCGIGSFLDIMDAIGPLSDEEVGAVTHCMLCGLRYLHDEQKTIHRDVKAGNILLTSDSQADPTHPTPYKPTRT